MGGDSPAPRPTHPGDGGVIGAHLPAGYSVAVGEFDGNSKTKGKAGPPALGFCAPLCSGCPLLLWDVGPAPEPCPSPCPCLCQGSLHGGGTQGPSPCRVRGGGPQQEQHGRRGERCWCPAAWGQGCPAVRHWARGGTLGMGTAMGPDAALSRWRSSVRGRACAGCRASPASRYLHCTTTLQHPLHPAAWHHHPIAAPCSIAPSPHHLPCLLPPPQGLHLPPVTPLHHPPHSTPCSPLCPAGQGDTCTSQPRYHPLPPLSQVASYFGHTVAVADINGDG